MEEYVLQAKLKNNLILQRILDAGYKTPGEFMRAHDLDITRTYALLNLKGKAVTNSGEWKAVAKRLAYALGCEPDFLFTEQQRITELPTNVAMVPISEATLRLAADPSELLENQDLANRILEMAGEQLTARENKVLRLRFIEENTLDECAKEFDVTRERIRQIETKAMRKMREMILKNRHALGVGVDAVRK